MSTHSYIAIICNRSRGSFCCTLLACQRRKKHWMISQSIIREARLFAHTSVLMQVKGEERQGGRLVFCDILHFLLLPALLVESQRADVYMQQVEAKVWDVLYLLDACFKSLHHQFHRQIIQLLSETAWIVSVCVHTSVIKERIKKYSGSRATDAVENHFSLSLLVKTSKNCADAYKLTMEVYGPSLLVYLTHRHLLYGRQWFNMNRSVNANQQILCGASFKIHSYPARYIL